MIDPNSCSGHGDCVDVAPSVFRLEACPAAAVQIIDNDSGEQIYP